MPKQLAFNTSKSADAHDKIRSGIKQLAEAVKVTLGPSGRVVMYEREFGDPAITKDGVTVAKQVELSDPMENMAASMVRQAAAKTGAIAGDGTTTATVYTEAVFEAGIKSVRSGANPQEVKRGIDYAAQAIIRTLGEMARPVIDLDQIKRVAICSSNQDVEIGTMIADAMDRVGKDGVVTIEEGRTLETSVVVVDGLQFPRGYASPQFATNPETLVCEYEEPRIFITDQRIGDLKQLLQILESIVKNGGNRPLVMIADDFADECLAALILNRVRGHLQVVAVKAPGFGDRRTQTLDDIAVATGATLLTRDDIARPSIGHLGTCKKITIDRDTTTIVEGGGDEAKVQERTNMLRNQLEKMAGDFDRERVQERLARLAGGIAQIVVGGATEVEIREKKDRIDDALHACKAAIEEGILPGGGVAVLHALKSTKFGAPNEDFRIGVDIVARALEAPLRQIAINTGVDEGVVVNKIKESDSPTFGFDAAAKRYGDMLEFGIVVPAKVERVALQNATSISGLLLTTDCMISIDRDKSTAPAADAQFPSFG